MQTKLVVDFFGTAFLFIMQITFSVYSIIAVQHIFLKGLFSIYSLFQRGG